MTDKDIYKDLEKLKEEINNTISADSPAKETLIALINDVEKRVEEPLDEDQDDTLLENMKDAISRFETEHPRATAILNDIMVTLSNMGI